MAAAIDLLTDIEEELRQRVPNREGRVGFLLLIGVIFRSSGCGVEYHVRCIDECARQRQPAVKWTRDVQQLANYPRSKTAAVTLIGLLQYDDEDIRCCAVTSLKSMLISDPNTWDEVDRALVGVLDDHRCGSAYVPLLWPLPYTGRMKLGSVRAQALYVLTQRTNEDFGFDQTAWRHYFEERERESGLNPSSGPTATTQDAYSRPKHAEVGSEKRSKSASPARR